MGPYLRKYNFLVKEVQMKCGIMCGGLSHGIHFSFVFHF